MGRDAYVTNLAFFFQFLHGLKLDIGTAQVMHLHQINLMPSQLRERILHATDSIIPVFPIDFRGHKHFIPQARIFHQMSQHDF